MKHTINYLFTMIVGMAVGIAAYGSYKSHNYSMSTEKPEPQIEYVYIEAEPIVEVVTETVYVEVEPDPYRNLTEEDCFYLMDLALREAEGEGVEGMLWVMYTAECRKEAFGLESYKAVWASDAFATSWNRRGIEPNEDCIKAMALFEEGWVPKPLWFRRDYYHGFGTPLCSVGDHYFSSK